MVRTDRWKYSYYVGHADELYDIIDDPGETRNLAADPGHQPVVRQLRDALLDWLITADETDQIAPRWCV
jgi:arylsulfatase A-like enzyme